MTIRVLTSGLVYEAVQRMMKYDFEVDASIMLMTSSIGICLDIIMGCLIHQHGHSHKTNGLSNSDPQEIRNELFELINKTSMP